MAVPVFMLISGYVYALSYKRNGIEQVEEAYLLKNVVQAVADKLYVETKFLSEVKEKEETK